MKFDVTIRIEPDRSDEIIGRLGTVLSVVDGIRELLAEQRSAFMAMQAAINELREEVAATRGDVQSAITLINGLADRLEQAADDPQEVRALVAELRAERQALGTAVAENPLPAEAPVEEPPVE
jgi:chromosome segregation ATPase